MMKIDKDIPPPKWGGKRKHTIDDDMVYGDSVWVATPEEVNRITTAIWRKGGRPTRRFENGGWRVWKMKLENQGE